jgi:uncharacterized membrane protein
MAAYLFIKRKFIMKKFLTFLIIVVIIAAGIVGGVYYKKSHANKQNQETTTAEVAEPSVEATDPNVIEVNAINGQSVLDALKVNNQVDYTDSSNGALVNAINSINNSDTKFWTYTVNGTEGTVAADKYICKDGDQIVWEYKEF